MSTRCKAKRGDICMCCWLYCVHSKDRVGGNGWPCTSKMRLWVKVHASDRGDERGYVTEMKEGQDGTQD